MNNNEKVIETDVLIVGYGPVGACLAALLGQYSTKTMVIDKLDNILDLPRAIALDNEALRILQMIDISEHNFEQIGIQEVRMHCPYVGEFGKANTSGTIDGHPKLITFYQPELEKALREKVSNSDTVDVALETELVNLKQSKDGVTAFLTNKSGEQYQVQARYVVGADGASSYVRNLIGQGLEGETYREDWLVVDANHTNKKKMNFIEFVCNPKRPTPHMPAPGNRERWEFMLHPNEKKEEMEQADKLNELLSSWENPQNLNIERQAVYRFHARCCDSFQKDRVFLVGDAAHVTPPFVGQGLVAGLRDVANLAWKLSCVIDKGANPKLLDSYDQERRPHAKEMIDMAKFMGKLVMPRSVTKAILIHGLMRLIRLVPPARDYFEELKIKPANKFKKGLFYKGKSAFVRGGQLPQELLRTSQGIEWSDDMLGDQLTVLGFGVDPRSKVDYALTKKWEEMGGTFLHIGTRGHRSELNTSFAEALEKKFSDAGKQEWIVIVRPDRVVMIDGEASKAKELVSKALRIIQD